MNVRLMESADDAQWDAYAGKHPYGCVFHHSAWKEVLLQSFPQLKPLYLAAEDENGNIIGGLPLMRVKSVLTGSRLVSLPFSLYCDPLVDSPEIFSRLRESACSEYQSMKSGFVVFRIRFNPAVFHTDHFHDFVGYKNHTLALDPDPEKLMPGFHRKSIRTNIRKAEKAGVRVTEAASEEDMRLFFDLNVETRRKFGTPPQPYSFFRNMWRILHPRGMLMVHIAWMGKDPAGALLCLKSNGRIHAEYIGVKARYQPCSPNLALFWTAIRQSCLQGYRFFEFGGTVASNEGLLQFKRRWGTVEEDIHHFYHPSVRGFSSGLSTSWKYGLLSGAMKPMPKWLFIQAGKLIYRHLGG
jgi:CelD/BcsL family acetyltransferase involved in cellulose biosynthesis